MVKQNRKCLACSTKYSYCPTCSRSDVLKPSWYNDFCGESCKDLWFTLTKYNMNRVTKAEAKSTILDLDLKPIESYVQCVQRDYAKVMAEEKKARRTQRKIESVVETEPIHPEQPEVAESHEVVKQENE